MHQYKIGRIDSKSIVIIQVGEHPYKRNVTMLRERENMRVTSTLSY